MWFNLVNTYNYISYTLLFSESCHLPFLLSCKKSCVARWMAWEVVSSSYTLHGYSITENQANLVFNAYVYKKAFITYYVRVSVITTID